MDETNALKYRDVSVDISGASGTSKEDAITTAFGNLKTEVAKSIQGIIVYIRPKTIAIKNCEVKEYTERFLFVLMPRKKEKVNITLHVVAEVGILEI